MAEDRVIYQVGRAHVQTLDAVIEKLRELLAQGYGDMMIKVHDGRVDYVELTRKAKTAEDIRRL